MQYFKGSKRLYFAITFALFAFEKYAKADTIILADKPTTTIKVSDATSSKTPVFECTKSKAGPRGNPVKVPGSTSIWTSATLSGGIDNAGEILGAGKFVYICKSKLMDNSTGRMKSASLE